MPEQLQPDDLDRLLRERFAVALDPQCGRAVARFQQASAPNVPPRQRRFAAAITVALTALAASIALGILIPLHPRRDRAQSTSPLSIAKSPAVPVELDCNVSYKNGGVVMLDPATPAQCVYRHRVDTVRWSDPADNATIELRRPADDVVLTEMQKQ